MTISQKIANICQALRLTCKVSNPLTCKVYMFEFSHRNLWILFFQTLIRHNQGRVYHHSIPKELEFMDNFNPAEPYPQSPHVTLWGLRTLIYILQYWI